jgi:hypothetical protein
MNVTLETNLNLIRESQKLLEEARAQEEKAKEAFYNEFHSLDVIKKLEEIPEREEHFYVINKEFNILFRSMVQSSKRIEILNETTRGSGIGNLYLTVEKGLKIPYKHSAIELFSDFYSWRTWNAEGEILKLEKNVLIARKVYDNESYSNEYCKLHFDTLLKPENRNKVNQKKVKKFFKLLKRAVDLWKRERLLKDKNKLLDFSYFLKTFNAWSDDSKFETAYQKFGSLVDKSKYEEFLDKISKLKEDIINLENDLKVVNKPFRIIEAIKDSDEK